MATPDHLNLLAISIGNTRIRIGAFIEGELCDTATLDHSRREAIAQAVDQTFIHMRDREGAGILLASVVPALTDVVADCVREQLGRDAARIERDFAVPIGRQLDSEALVGQDRLLNAAAAYDVLQQACVIVDAGTAMTVDFVDGAGTFHGGAILPGGQTMLNAMNQYAAQLPAVELTAPDESIGHNTTQAMLVGVYHGLRGALRELVEAYAEQAGAFPMVVGTGGDANLLFRDYALIDRIVPHLTLNGMLVTWRVAFERKSQSEN